MICENPYNTGSGTGDAIEGFRVYSYMGPNNRWKKLKFYCHVPGQCVEKSTNEGMYEMVEESVFKLCAHARRAMGSNWNSDNFD